MDADGRDLWNQSILLIGVSKTGMVYYTLPIFSRLMAWYFLDEDIGLLHFGQWCTGCFGYFYGET